MTTSNGLLLAARTMRHLRVRQVLGRGWRAVRGRPSPRDIDTRWHQVRGAAVASALGALGPVDGEARLRAATDAWRAGQLKMLGASQPAPHTWRESSPSPLWAYHTQYHDAIADAMWVAAADDDTALQHGAEESLARWLDAWGDGGGPAWDAYPTAVRTVNWVRLMGWVRLSPRIEEALQHSLPRQLDVLARDLEWHLDGNHLLHDAWALAIAPYCFDGPWAGALGQRGRSLFWRELLAQVGEDGVHEERSPMYHARALRGALEVLAVHDALGVPVPGQARARVGAMAAVLPWLCHADGALRLQNDSAADHGVDLSRITSITRTLTGVEPLPAHGLWWARDAGFAAVHDRAHGDALFMDLGPPSPGHQPGHAHAGALAFELDLDGRAVVVDGGCSGYDGDSWRPWLRSTAAHSTVVIDGRDQSEMWATFRVARRARVEGVHVSGDERACELRAACRPYHRPRAKHQRQIRRDGREVRITDRVVGAHGAPVEGWLHFAPEWEATRAGDDAVELRQGTARVVVRLTAEDEWSLHRGERAPARGWRATGWGRVVPAWSLRIVGPAADARPWHVTINPA